MQAHLERVDAGANLARFYRVSLQPELFGGVALVREWGRLGSPGTVRATPYASEAEALAALAQVVREKRRRGYRARG